MEEQETTTLGELRKQKEAKKASAWFKKHMPFLFDWRSLFYFGVLVVLVGFCWMGFSLVANYGTQLYGWDYMSQYVEFYYHYWDVWHEFFRTGHFTMYDPAIYLGGDNIGSMSYYGLFDPFVFLNVLFPRSWVPQMTAIFTVLKATCAAFGMRAYLKYMGVRESTSRIGALAYAFSGFVNFFVGFPSFVSAVVFIPIILLGIEKVIKEKKIATLVWSLALLGIVSFFFLVVMCVWGVIYSLWRFFWTIKQRKAKDSWAVLGLGVASFILGLMLCSWSLLPSIRQSALSGRGQSIAYLYLQDLLNALKTFDVKRVFARLFEMVGDHPGREIMGIVSFFYPTCNYLWLPLYGGGASTGYDAWTSSLFIYTPMIIFFVYELINNVRKRDWEHIISFVLCSYCVLTIFAYFFSFAFTGDGYGRWYIILIPLLIRQACRGMDHRKEAPKWQLPVASSIVAVATLLTFFMVKWVLQDKTFENTNYMTYWQKTYNIPAYVTRNGDKYTTLWLSIYQMCLVVVESVVIYFTNNRKCFKNLMTAFVAVEIVVCGNISFLYGSSYNYGKYFNGGYDNKKYSTTTATQLTEAFQYVTKEYDTDTLYRAYADYPAQKNMNYAMGYNGTTPWSSLFNYSVLDFSHYSHVIENEYSNGTPYGKKNVSSRWSGYYNNKRFSFDLNTGIKYYAIVYEDTGMGDLWDNDDFKYNVPFGSKCVFKNDKFRIYENPYHIELGRAVDGVFKENAVDKYLDDGTIDTNHLNHSDFYRARYGVSGYQEIVTNEEAYFNGAIVKDDAIIPEGIDVLTTPSFSGVPFKNLTSSLKSRVFENVPGYGFNYKDPGAFLVDSSYNVYESSYHSPYSGESFNGTYYNSGPLNDGKLVWSLGSGDPYMNEDPNGAYFLMAYDNKNISRIYMIGDTFNEDGTIKKQNTILNYEYHAFDNVNSQISGSYSGLFGIYAEGRVRQIVFSKKNGESGVSPTPFLLVQEKCDFDAKYASLTDSDHLLTDVEYINSDHFRAKSNFSKSKAVVTTLGYDAGWKVVARTKGASGEYIETELPTTKMNGGFVGFFAPEGEVEYELTYVTPYVKGGIALSAAAGVIFFGYEITLFAVRLRKRRKEII